MTRGLAIVLVLLAAAIVLFAIDRPRRDAVALPLIVALAASTAFMTPISSPVNALVVTPGNYTFGDFVRIGVPFSLIVLGIPWGL
jgi:di/tricarboxylate transporter